MRFSPRRPNWPILVASLILASCLVAAGYALDLAITGSESQNLPTAIESIDPLRGARQVPSQTSILVDLETGYEGVLVVDGLELETVRLDELQDESRPGQQVTLPATTIFEPGNATLTFDPSENAEISSFTQGEHIIKVIYWKSIEGRGSALTYTWSFEVF